MVVRKFPSPVLVVFTMNIWIWLQFPSPVGECDFKFYMMLIIQRAIL